MKFNWKQWKKNSVIYLWTTKEKFFVMMNIHKTRIEYKKKIHQSFKFTDNNNNCCKDEMYALNKSFFFGECVQYDSLRNSKWLKRARFHNNNNNIRFNIYSGRILVHMILFWFISSMIGILHYQCKSEKAYW